MKRIAFTTVVLIITVGLVAACTQFTNSSDSAEVSEISESLDTTSVSGPPGPEGPEGPQGAPGPPGVEGPEGPPGEDYTPPTYVGSLICEGCHEDLYASFMETGHPYKLNKVVGGEAPAYPFSEVPDPPEGYTWDDILYVIGGYGWKARFIDKEGYIITGDEDARTQYNLYNSTLKMGDDWVPYHAGEEKSFDCGSCHTTGYVPEGHQDGLPGLIGTWAEDGIGCEACHGQGSAHVDDPYQVKMPINRSSESCGSCHRRGDVTEIEAQDGFIRHHEQYEELYESKKRVMRCVDCHDPHQTTKYAKGLGIKTDCENCHFNNALYQKITDRRHAKCVDCHMPRVTKSALGDPEQFSGDVRTHLMAINPKATSQFDEDGEFSKPYLALDFACRGCHYPGGRGKEISDEMLVEAATGYHDRDQAGSANKQR